MALEWTKDDDFEQADPFGSLVVGYIGLEPSTSDGSGGTGVYGGKGGALFNGYTDFSGGASMMADPLDGSLRERAGCVRRETFAENVQATTLSRKWSISADQQSGDLLAHSIFLRVQGGTVVDSGGDFQRVRNSDCYEMARTWTGSAYVVAFIRWNGGTPTVLFTSAPFAVNHIQTFRLTFSALTVSGGATVELRGSIQPVGSSETAFGPVSDSSGSRVLGEGRVGFGLDIPRLVDLGLRESVSVIDYFEVDTYAAGGVTTPLFLDVMTRSSQSVGKSVSNIFAQSGRLMSCDYLSDAAGRQTFGTLAQNVSTAQMNVPASALRGAADLNGTSDYLTLVSPTAVWPTPTAIGANSEWTVAVWARLDGNRDGNRLYECEIAGTGNRFAFGILNVAGSGDLQVQAGAYFGIDGATADEVLGAPLDADDYVGELYCYVLTYKANTNLSTGEGTVSMYAGRNRTVTLLGSAAVAANARPVWPVVGSTHRVGKVFGVSSPTADAFLDGVVARVDVFWKALSVAQVRELCDEYALDEWPAAYDHRAGWLMSGAVDVGGKDRYPAYKAVNLAGTSAAWEDQAGASAVTTGPMPVVPVQRVISLHARPVQPYEGQHRSIVGTVTSPFERFGVIVNGEAGEAILLWEGYALEVGVGKIANVYRVDRGDFYLIAAQDPDSPVSNVSLSTPTKAALEAFADQPGNPTTAIRLRAKIDDVVVPLVPLGVDVFLVGSGVVVDRHADRKIDGRVTGFFGSPIAAPVVVDDWNGEDPSAAGVNVADLPSLETPLETDGATGDLGSVVTPSWEVRSASESRQTREEMESGRSRVYRAQVSTAEVWEWTSRGLSLAEVAAVETFWEGHGAGELGFALALSQFVPGEEDGTFAFVEDSFQTWQEGGALACRFLIERLVDRVLA